MPGEESPAPTLEPVGGPSLTRKPKPLAVNIRPRSNSYMYAHSQHENRCTLPVSPLFGGQLSHRARAYSRAQARFASSLQLTETSRAQAIH